MLCGVEVSEDSSLIPHEETNDFSHARTFVIPHEESPLFLHAICPGPEDCGPWSPSVSEAKTCFSLRGAI